MEYYYYSSYAYKEELIINVFYCMLYIKCIHRLLYIASDYNNY